MMRKVVFLLVAAVLCSGQMCASPTPPTCLELVDVTNIPPGDAVGSVFAGNYRVLSGYQQSCYQCGENTIPEAHCENFQIGAGSILNVTQQDGAMQWVNPDDPSQVYAGAVDGDGRFRVGLVTTSDADDSGGSNGRALILLEGQLGTAQVVATARIRFTFNDYVYPGINDLESIAEIVYERVE